MINHVALITKVAVVGALPNLVTYLVGHTPSRANGY